MPRRDRRVVRRTGTGRGTARRSARRPLPGRARRWTGAGPRVRSSSPMSPAARCRRRSMPHPAAMRGPAGGPPQAPAAVPVRLVRGARSSDHHLARGEGHDVIGQREQGGAVGDHHHSPASGEPPDRLDEGVLGQTVEVGGRFVEQQNGAPRRKARARATRWRAPADSPGAASPRRVSSPSRRRATSPVRAAARGRIGDVGAGRPAGQPHVLADGAEANRYGRCGTQADRAAPRVRIDRRRGPAPDTEGAGRTTERQDPRRHRGGSTCRIPSARSPRLPSPARCSA